MKRSLSLIILIFYVCSHVANGQACGSPNVNTMGALPVCGTYGDANGNSNWNWELTDINDPSFCSQWFARTNSGATLEAMGSPFFNSPTIALDNIAQQQDFTKAKGWELLRRDFGCGQVAAFPYFVLYNRYSGLLRIFVYIPSGQDEYSAIAAEIKPDVSDKYPATTAFTDTIQMAPDKYRDNSPGNFGLGMVSIGELSGEGEWSFIEFNTSFDPNIQHANFLGAQLEFKIYGVTHGHMEASIRGASVTTGQVVSNFTYKPSSPMPTNNGNGTFDFKGVGEKFTKFSTGITDVRKSINDMATSVVNVIGSTNDSLLKQVKGVFEEIKKYSSDNGTFAESFGKIGEAAKAAGSFFKIFASLVGLFSGSGSGGGPSYTTYDLVLQGTVTTKVIISSVVLRVPGTLQNDNSNATYYKCPLGIFNVKNTPEVDVVNYWRTDRYWVVNQFDVASARQYKSYKIRNNLIVSFNDGAGLELVSAQAAIVGEILPKSDGTASYDLFEPHGQSGFADRPLSGSTYYHNSINHMRADLENHRLEIKQYDTKKQLHIFQTPYTNIECLNGLAFNVLASTKVYLQVKAVLKKKNDLTQTPIIYIANYKLDTVGATISSQLRDDLLFNVENTLPPYHNYTELPTYNSDHKFIAPQPLVTNLSGTQVIKADHTISNPYSSNVNVNSGANITFSAGGSITLNPGFSAVSGSTFDAKINNYGYTLTCITPTPEAYVHPLACYNTAISAFRIKPTAPAEESNQEADVKAYPVPSPKTVYITGIKNHKNSTLHLIDQSGRTVRQLQINAIDAVGTISVDVSGLSNGVYFIKIQTAGTITTKKIVVGK